MIRRLSLAVALSLMGFGQVIADKCLSYEPTEVTLRGTLRSEIFPGPPNYESIKNGDRKETTLLLKLSENICTTGKDDFGGPEGDIRELQLVVTKDQDWKTIRRLMGKQVKVTGTLFHAHTGHHRTKVLIAVARISRGV